MEERPLPSHIEDDKGLHIAAMAGAAISFARIQDKPSRITFTFNEIPLSVRPDSAVEDIVHIYSLKHELRRTS